MYQEATSVQFTVGKLDAGMAILLSSDHHVRCSCFFFK